jgi:hypothetical protein
VLYDRRDARIAPRQRSWQSMLMPPPGTDQGSRCVAALICGRMMATASPFSVLRHRDAPHFDERALRNNNALKRWTWTTRMSASVEIVRSDSPQRLALMEESAELKRLKRENGELCSAAPISTVNLPGLVDDTTATGPGVSPRPRPRRPTLYRHEFGFEMQARPCPVRVTRRSDQADWPVALCASGCGWGHKRLMMKKPKTHSRTTGSRSGHQGVLGYTRSAMLPCGLSLHTFVRLARFSGCR